MEESNQYDLSALNDLFIHCITPAQLCEELVALAFDYASHIEEGEEELFKSNMSTIYVLYEALKEVNPL